MARTIRIQDTLTGSERELEPREPGKVGIYACGPTVYAPVHVGNARPYVVFSLFKRFLEHEGYEVTLVANVTDVNDKIYDAAREAGVPSEQLAREMTERYERDTDGLGLGRPDAEPKASETIEPIVALIGDLIESGHAYAAEGDVYYRVGAFGEYGKLSNRPLEEMSQGEDDAATPGLKESPLDFALWKAQKEGEDTAWDAPWGRGRPGWHIECSAMAEQILGVDFDVHGGGSDLIFPHHENEIAQTEAARGKRLARLWMHNGMLQFDTEKMSKSVGNIRSLAGALEEYGRDALVMYFAQGHYRKPVDFSEGTLAQASAAVGRIRDFAARLDPDGAAPAAVEPYAERFFDALADDFNTPAALAVVFDWISEANRRIDSGERFGAGVLEEMLAVLGLDNLLRRKAGRSVTLSWSVSGSEIPEEEALRLLEEREQARVAKDFATADARRDQLAELGWDVRDSPEGPQLTRRS
jgi:cysteinyl-tRNA synthetase